MIQNQEPQKLIAGYSVSWRKHLPAYASALFTLQYLLRRSGGNDSKLLTASPDSAFSYLIEASPSDTADLTAGDYSLTGYVTDDATGGQNIKDVVFAGMLTVLPDPVSATGDQRSFYQQMVVQLRATLLKLSSGTIATASVNGKSYTQRDLAQVRAELARFEELLANEQIKDRLGDNVNPNRIMIRFTNTL
jgi:hypothetical protein